MLSKETDVKQILELVGGAKNIQAAESCMTRMRFSFFDISKVDKQKIEKLDFVINVVESKGALQVVVGPGKAKKMIELIKAEMDTNESGNENDNLDWQANKQSIKGKQKSGKIKSSLASIANIFIPLIPAIIAAGLFNGVAGLLKNLQASGTLPTNNDFLSVTILFLTLMGSSLMAFFTIYVGINSAKVFGATLALGGMVGAMTIISSINEISKLLGLFNEQVVAESILQVGRGGILAVIFGVYILSKIEKFIRKHTPDVLDLIITPTLTILTTSVVLVFVLMPVLGWVSDKIMFFLNLLINSPNPIVDVIGGYVLAAAFLPLVLVGMHQALVPIYALQLEQLGGITLFPVLAMAGAGQVGACIAIYIKAKRMKKHNVTRTIAGALPAGILGIGEPLLYGVTLPMGKPFLTGGLGAGFGGAYIMLMDVKTVSWGTSGLPGLLLTNPQSMIHYLIGLAIAVLGGLIISYLFVGEKHINRV